MIKSKKAIKHLNEYADYVLKEVGFDKQLLNE